jgi:transcription elongation factor Elf1
MSNVFDIGDYELTRQRYRPYNSTECQHKKLLSEDEGEILTCKDCGKQVSAYWVLMRWLDQYQKMIDNFTAQRAALIEDNEKAVVHRAALKIEEEWRRKKYVPTCPHCRKGITPMDGFGSGKTSDKQNALPMVMKPNLEVVTNEEL